MAMSPVPQPEVAGVHPDGAIRPPWVALLGETYCRLGLTLPPITRLLADDVRAPYRQLLVHSNDMTPTLEEFHGGPVRLRVLGRTCTSATYQREVVLELERDGRPVEYGAICVHLDHLPEAARRRVLAEESPFGRILQQEAIAHLSWPQAFFAVTSDRHMSRLLDAREAAVLYGRRNVLVDGHRRLLADVIEIVAPVLEPTCHPL
jgi:chorismate-pyruvate lyase